MEFVLYLPTYYLAMGGEGGDDLYQLSAYIRTMRVRGCQIPLDPFNPCTPHTMVMGHNDWYDIWYHAMVILTLQQVKV